ncbi:MAG: hypothetical protein HZA89_08195 [Verrucomicrobia bacterium]|nr:hypothetical protein [Verrucomicrobiota bacterium]
MIQNLNENHPLFLHLKEGILHCTSARHYWMIEKAGAVMVNNGQFPTWGRSCCQEVGGVSVFDFETATREEIFENDSPEKWCSILRWHSPVNVVIKFDRNKLPGPWMRYPEMLKGTRGNVIPNVEVCHLAPIPILAAVSFVLICPADFDRFYVEEKLTRKRLAEIRKEFAAVCEASENASQRAHESLMNDLMNSVNEEPFRALSCEAQEIESVAKTTSKIH